MGKIFLSYAYADLGKINQQIGQLKSFGYDIWADTSALKVGTHWNSEIVNAISNCDAFLLFLSNSSMKSNNIRAEVQIAYDHNRRIIPIKLEKVTIPPELEFILAGSQWIDAEEVDFFARLFVALGSDVHAEKLKPPRPLKVALLYSTIDKDEVIKIYSNLKKDGFSPWMDIYNISPGEETMSAVSSAVIGCDVILLCLSRKAISQEVHLQDSFQFAINYVNSHPQGHTYLFPLKLDDCDIPNILREWQWVSLYDDYARGWQRLIFAMLEREKDTHNPVRKLFNVEKERQQNVFVAMPFSPEMEDIYYYGIQRAVSSVGFNCYRSDKVAFVGDILQEIKKELEGSVAVVADLTDSNPNVYLEIGFAWGKDKPTILIVKQGDKLRFDVQGQKCLPYSNIRNLEEVLTRELKELKEKGVIH
jgi:hypothetical protein